ncbi:hypothetical protein GCM10025777_49490 [Membranihabitans marinus]|uniref:N-acetyltransferase domain-containing protein n=2 Tax=Nesterenkonia rhizosphaerae TaxID=1348272 RepID=A0ABP9FRI4_9MICC
MKNMPRPWTIRTPTVEDAAALGRMQNQGWKQAYQHFLPAWYYGPEREAQRIQKWTELLSQGLAAGEKLRIAEDPAGAVVGFSHYGPAHSEEDPCPMELHSIYVLASHHGTGLADQLLEQTLGSGPAFLEMFKDNTRAQRYYLRHGFRVIDGEWDVGQWRNDDAARGIKVIRMMREGKKDAHA